MTPFDLLILFVAATPAGAILVWLNQPAVIGELMAGIIIGPFAFGWVGLPDLALVELVHGDREVAREAVNLTLDTLAELGVIVLLFFIPLSWGALGEPRHYFALCWLYRLMISVTVVASSGRLSAPRKPTSRGKRRAYPGWLPCAPAV